MKKKVLAMLLMTAVTMGTLAGCGSADSASSETGNGEVLGAAKAEESGVTDDFSKAQEISIWLYKDDYKVYDSYNENPIVQYLNDKFNCTLSFQQPAMGSETEQFSLMLGTGSYTDVMEVTYSQAGVSSLYADGVIVDLAPYVESCMPNFKAFLEADENVDVKRALYDKEGHLFTIPNQVRVGDENRWGGLVYRKDIVDTMTGGYVSYPSGKEVPTTVEDWEYILSLQQQYFAAAGLADSACLIIPAEGYFTSGELLTGFGTGPDFYVDDNGKVVFGPTQEGFYNYLTTMKDWYSKGYVYKDFASRTNDVFYLPNTALTYGGAAGVWFGMDSQLDGAMSLPEYGLEVDVQPIASPLYDGVDKALSWSSLENGRVTMNSQGYVVSSSCSEEKLVRFLSICDYLFSEEGAMLRSFGLTKEQGAADNKYYAEADMADGTYTMDNGEFTYAEPMIPNVGSVATQGASIAYIGSRLPGLCITEYSLQYASESANNASKVWKGTGIANDYPNAISLNVEDNDKTSSNYSTYHDYMVTMIPKFIMGTEELSEDSFKTFVDQLNKLGVEENTEIYQRYYDEFVK